MAGRFSGTPDYIHEATDFVIGLGQTIPHLSAQAQTKLRGQIVGGLKTNGLRPLQHEMRVAGLISKLGCDVTFADLEGDGGYDFLADKDGVTYEVEAKSLSDLLWAADPTAGRRQVISGASAKVRRLENNRSNSNFEHKG